MSEEGSDLVDELMRFRPDGLTANAWAVKAGVSRTIWADLKRHGNPSRKTLEKLLVAAGSSLAEFEALRIGPDLFVPGEGLDRLAEKGGLFRGAQLPPIPLVASHSAKSWVDASGLEAMWIVPTEVIDHLSRPDSLAGDRAAYAITMVGKSMWPRFRAGRRIAVSPAAAISNGDDVLVIAQRSPAQAGCLVLLGEMVRQTSLAICLRQFTPARSSEIPMADAAAVHRVLGELI